MKLYISIRQLFRSPVRVLLYALILAVITAFFCLSLNLWQNSEANLRLADETFKTIAILELYADVDERGNLLSESDEGYAGYLPTAVNGYDLTPIVNAPGVIRYDLRARYGAYIPGEVAKRPVGITSVAGLIFNFDIIRFTIDADEPIAMQNLALLSDINIRVLESAADFYSYNDVVNLTLYVADMEIPEHAAAIRAISGTDDAPTDTVLLRPYIEYVASVMCIENSLKLVNGEARTFVDNIIFRHDLYGTDLWVSYSMQRGELLRDWPTKGQPFAMQLYDDVLRDSELCAYYEQAKNAYYISARSFGVMTTDDVLGVPAFHLGGVYMHEGRIFTQTEYDDGAQVCMISSDLALAQGWSVGDTVDMNFYQYDYFLNNTYIWSEHKPIYRYVGEEGYFDRGQYTIIGIYSQRHMTGTSTVSESALSVPWNTVFVPKKSVQNAPDERVLPVSGALLTIWLKNGSIDEFLNEMDSLGLTMQKSGDYETKFTFYDQGYSKIQPSLVALSGTAELLLIVSAALLLCATVLLAFFYALSQKQAVGVMRMLGCSKSKALITVLLSAALIALAGVCIGAYCGHELTTKVGSEILAEAANEPTANTAFSAFLAADQEIEIEFALDANARTTLLALLVGLMLFLLPLCGFALNYLQKGPRELLPQGRE